MLTDQEDPAIKRARTLASMLGIPFYVQDGLVHQTPPGLRIDPPPGRNVETASRGSSAFSEKAE